MARATVGCAGSSMNASGAQLTGEARLLLAQRLGQQARLVEQRQEACSEAAVGNRRNALEDPAQALEQSDQTAKFRQLAPSQGPARATQQLERGGRRPFQLAPLSGRSG